MTKKNATAATVMLRTNWPGNFGRTVYREYRGKQEVVERLEFVPGQPRQLTKEQLDAVKEDIGSALVEVEFDEKNRPRVVGEAVGESQSPERLAEMESTIAAQQEAIDLLVAQVKELGGVPVVAIEGDEASSADSAGPTSANE